MKQVLVKAGEVLVEEVAAPVAEPGTVLVSVECSAISIGTELSGVRASGTPLWKRALNQPANVKRVLDVARTEGIAKARSMVEGKLGAAAPSGYSAAGVVLAVGEGVTEFAPGMRVACAGAGYANHAEVIAVPRNLVVAVPDDVTWEQAATVTLGTIAMQGVRRAAPTLGEAFVVVGLGILGQLTVQLLKANGCKVVGIDLDASRVERALSLGMDAALDPATDEVDQVLRLSGGFGADGAIVTAAGASDEILSLAFRVCRRKGRVVLVGDVGLGIKRGDIYEKELDFLISTSYGPGRYDAHYEEEGLDYPVGYVRWTENRNMAEYLRLVGDGLLDVDALIDARYEIDRAPEAFAALSAGGPSTPLAVLLTYPRPAEARVARRVETPGASPISAGVVRLAVVGAGGYAKAQHLPNLAGVPELHLRSVVSRTGSNAANVAKQFGADWSGTDFADVLADADTDAVLIATRHDLHAKMALEALGAGKHVLVEKPLALTPAELDAVLAFFDGRDDAPVLLTGFNRRFSPYARRIAELTFGRTSPLVIDYRMNAGYIPLDSWVHGPEGGGRNIGEACHIYDLFTYLTGAEVTDVVARSARPLGGHYSPADNFVATATFADGSIATLTYTAMGSQAHPKERMEVFCDGVVYSLDDYRSLAVAGSSAGGLSTPAQDKGQRAELAEFARGVLAGEWPSPLWQQAQAMRIAFAVDEQLKGG